jgi:23S rRNA (adenine2030-N6)-methyltransferase
VLDSFWTVSEGEFSEVALGQREDVRLLEMANVHYARIGDVWKHLPLAEVLRIERPGRYWESHAGSSSYSLIRSPERDYGVFLFLERADRSSALEGSAYRRLLAPRECGRAPTTYPGSPRIAMELLGNAAGRFVFCDLDGASLANIAEDARALGVPSSHVQLVKGDGVSTLDGELAELTEDETAETFLHVDPYRPLEPGRGGETPLNLFSRAAERGVGCMLWYGFDARTDRAVVLDALREGIAGRAWYGEVSLRAEDLSEVGFDPGVLGCGVVMCNVSQEALAACGRLGKGLTHVYSGARLPNGRDGALEFVEGSL